MKTLILIHAASTFMMIGVIWTIQIVHYPLFSAVGTESFQRFEAGHINRITLLVMPIMLVELITGFMLVTLSQDAKFSILAWVGLVLIGLIWIVTGLVNVPQHNMLSSGFSSDVHDQLVTTNWFRTISWSVRGLVAGIMTIHIFGN